MVARQSGPMKMNHAYRRIVHEVRSKKSLWGVWCKLRLREDRGEDPLRLKVCLRSTDEAENRNRAVVQKRSVVWNHLQIPARWTQIGTFVLQSSSIYSPFFLARFGMRELCAWFSRHVRNLHSACLSHEREYCAGVCYGDTERAFEV